MIVYWAGWDTNKKLFITVLIGCVFLAAFRYWPGNRGCRWICVQVPRGWSGGSSAWPRDGRSGSVRGAARFATLAGIADASLLTSSSADAATLTLQRVTSQ
jgi:hypothetical protein